MKLSKKYLRKLKKRLLVCMSSITICVMLIATSKLALFPMPTENISNTKRSNPSAFTDTSTTTSSKNSENRISNTDTDIYIYDTYDMEIFRNSVNAGNNYSGKTVHLMNDIDLSLICSEELGSWEPIGTYYTDFSGTFDGNYHTISNLYIKTEEQQTLGFFKKTGETGVIKNLLLAEVEITNNYGIPANNTYVGGIVGWHSEGAQIINCGIKSGTIMDEILVAGTESSQYGPVIGGIAGRSNGLIEGCYNKATIIGTASTSTSATDVMAGGIAGAGRGKLTNSYNTGEIVGTSYVNYVGGISGNTDNSYTGKIENTYNKGTVRYAGTTNYVGGILGRNGFMTDYEAIEFENSYATNSSLNTQYNYNGSSVVAETAGRITSDELKGSVVALGEEYAADLYGINEKDPILYWEAEYPPKAKLNVNQTYIEIGEALDLNVLYSKEIEEIIGHSYTSSDFKWTSTNEDIAKVNGNGRVTGLKEGYTTIYATYENSDVGEGLASARVLASCIINVTGKVATPQVATGNGFTVVLKADGTVWTIGNNEKGQLGNGTIGDGTAENNTDNNPGNVGAISIASDIKVPTQVKINETTYLTNIIKIAVGTDHVLALTKSGEIYAWGSNEYGQLATENTTTQTGDDATQVGAAISRPTEPYAKKVLGTDGMGTLKNIVDIGTGEKTSVALDKEGNVYEWGDGKDLPTKHKIDNIVRVSVGNGTVGALEANGLLWTWGENEKGQTGSNSMTSYTWPLAIETEVTEVSCGGRHTVIQKTDRKVYATGNLYGTKTFEEIELPETVTETNKLKYIKTGYDTTTIMLKDGTIYGEGGNSKGQLGIGTVTDAPKFTQGLTLVDNTNPDAVGAISNRPLENVIIIGDSIGDGSTTTLNTTAITENGDVYISGDNTYSQMDNNTTIPSRYYTRMGFIYLDYADKVIEIEQDAGYQIDRNKLRYKNSSVNVYSNDKEKALGEIKYTSFNTDIITVDENGYIRAYGKPGTVKVRIEDITNGYETYITVIAGRLMDTDTVEYIYNIEDLIKFRDSVNAGNDYTGKTVYLMADIDMSSACSETSGKSWEPIGNYASDTSLTFAGTFEGNYHKLSNLYYNSDSYTYVGLFAKNNGTIQDLILDNVDIYAYKTGVNEPIFAGGIAGGLEGNIVNCGINSGNITVYNNTKISSGYRTVTAGGITGNNAGTVMNCYNKANITGVNYYTKYTGTQAGGIVGSSSNSQAQVINCYNTGDISATAKNAYAGGIAGDIITGKNIINSYGIGSSTSNAGVFDAAGGIIGLNRGNNTVTNSYCGTKTTYSQRYDNGGYQTAGKIDPTETLKTYAGTLGSAYENDDFNINEGYPILWWEAPTIELNKKQAYIGVTETLQLKLIQNEDISNFLGKDLSMTDFEWKSTNEDVATVDENGLVMGTSDGYTTIYGTYKENEKINVMCIINVAGEKAAPQIETGNGFTAVLKADGTVWMTGNPDIIVTGTGANDTTVSTDGNATTVGARGTVPGLRRTCPNKNKRK